MCLRESGHGGVTRLPHLNAVSRVHHVLEVILQGIFDTGLVDTFIDIELDARVSTARQVNLLVVRNLANFAAAVALRLAIDGDTPYNGCCIQVLKRPPSCPDRKFQQPLAACTVGTITIITYLTSV